MNLIQDNGKFRGVLCRTRASSLTALFQAEGPHVATQPFAQASNIADSYSISKQWTGGDATTLQAQIHTLPDPKVAAQSHHRFPPVWDKMANIILKL
jgi:hypothetical protein